MERQVAGRVAMLLGLVALCMRVGAAEEPGVASQIAPRGMLAIYHEALKQDPRFQAARLQREAEGERLPLARAQLLPQVTLEADYTRTRQEILASDNTVFGSGTSTFPSRSYTLALTQPLFNWSSWQGFRKARAEVRAAQADFSAASMDLLLRVAERYFKVLGARADVASRKAEQVALKKNLAYARQRFGSGLTNIADLSDVKARDALVRASLSEDLVRLDDSRQELGELVGWGGMRLKRLDPEMPLPRPDPEDVAIWVDRAMQNNPDLVALMARAEVARHEVSVKRGGHYPTLGVTGRHNYRKTDGTLFGGGSEVATTDVSVSLSLPIYRGGATSAGVRQAVKQHHKAKQELLLRQREVERQVRSSFEKLRAGHIRIAALRESVAARQVVVEGRRRGERNGIYTQVSVADAEQDLQAAVRDLAQARYDYLLESLRLKRAAGLLALSDLQAIDAWLR